MFSPKYLELSRLIIYNGDNINKQVQRAIFERIYKKDIRQFDSPVFGSIAFAKLDPKNEEPPIWVIANDKIDKK